jgi:hypothetical protein
MSDRFDFEQQIMNCWNITEELKLLNEYILEKDLSTDETSNVILGLTQLYEIKFDKLFTTFEYLIKEKKIT